MISVEVTPFIGDKKLKYFQIIHWHKKFFLSQESDMNLNIPSSSSFFMENQEELNLGFLDDSEEEIRSVLIRNAPIIPR